MDETAAGERVLPWRISTVSLDRAPEERRRARPCVATALACLPTDDRKCAAVGDGPQLAAVISRATQSGPPDWWSSRGSSSVVVSHSNVRPSSAPFANVRRPRIPSRSCSQLPSRAPLPGQSSRHRASSTDEGVPSATMTASPPSLQPSSSLRETVRMLVTGTGVARDRVGSGNGGGTGDGAMASVEQEAASAWMDVGRLARARSPIKELYCFLSCAGH